MSLIDAFNVVILDMDSYVVGIKKFNGLTSNNKQFDVFIKKFQFQTNPVNDAYLEWIPFDMVYHWEAIISSTIISPTNFHQHYFEVILFGS